MGPGCHWTGQAVLPSGGCIVTVQLGGKKWDLGVTGLARLCSFLEDVSSRYGYIQTVLRGREFCFLIFLGF